MAAHNPKPKPNYSVKAYTPCKGKITLYIVRNGNEIAKHLSISQTYREDIKKLMLDLFKGGNITEDLLSKLKGNSFEFDRSADVRTFIYSTPSIPKEDLDEKMMEQGRATQKTMKLRSSKKYLCPIDKDNQGAFNSRMFGEVDVSEYQEQQYLTNLLSGNTLISKELKYYNTTFGSMWQNGPKHIIIPNQQKYPITEKDSGELVVHFNKLDEYEYKHEPQQKAIAMKEYLNFLFKFEFHYYTKGEPKNITEYSLKDCDKIIENIKRFYEQLRVDLNRDEFKHLLYHYFDKRNYEPRWRLTFGLFPVHTGYSYTSFVEHYRRIDLFEMMSMLKTGQLVYFREILSEYQKDVVAFCDGKKDGLIRNIYLEMDKYCAKIQEKPENELIQEPHLTTLTTGGKKYRLVGGSYIKDFDIVNAYAFSDDAVHCTDVIQIKVGARFFTVSLMNNTYAKIANTNEFTKGLIGKLLGVVGGKDLYGKFDREGSTYIEYTPSWVKVSIKESKPADDIRYIAIETGDDYWGKDGKNGIVHKIKGTVVSVSNLLVLFVLSHIRKERIQDKKKAFYVKDLLNPDKITDAKFLNIVEKLYENKYFRRLTNKLVLFDNFVAFKSSDKHIIWFCPAGFNIKMDKIDMFEQLVDYVLELIKTKNPISGSDVDKLEFEMIDDEKIANYLNESTTYNVEFNGELFMHNVRHIDDIRRVEIDEVISDYLKISKICGNFYVYAKYPNISKDNILHFHILDFNSGNVRKKELANVNIRYIEDIQHAILWERIKFNGGLSHSDIKVGYPLMRGRFQLSHRGHLIKDDKSAIKSFWIGASP